MSVNADQISAHAVVTEERGWWLMGRMRSEPRLFFELSFEDWHLSSRICIHPQVPVTYFGIHRGKGRLAAEFQLGQWPIKPCDEDVRAFIIDVMGALIGYRPVAVEPPDFNWQRFVCSGGRGDGGRVGGYTSTSVIR